MQRLKSNLIKKNLLKISSKGYKMTQLHFSGDGHGATNTGTKVCIFGATSNMGPQLAAHLVTKGNPCVMVHRSALDVISPLNHDLTLIRSNPYGSRSQFALNFNLIPDVKILL
jgi:hypothetical protein